MNKFLPVLVVCIFTCSSVAQAQEDTPAKPAEKELAIEATQTVEREVSEEEDSDEDTFMPTEKINVDSSVSFPVDI